MIIKLICRLLFLFLTFQVLVVACRPGTRSDGMPAEKPLYRDPVFDGAADPVVVWNRGINKHLMYYTNRRASVTDEAGVCWVHGSRIGIAVSDNGGASWKYLDTCDIRYRPDSEPTYWAPEIVVHRGSYHMYLTYVPGVFRDWEHPREIIHLTSEDGIQWDFCSRLDLASDKVIDASVFPLPEGGWRMWYNNERDKKSMYYADSPDLFSWTDRGKVTGLRRGEGAKVFLWKGRYRMLVDEWHGLGVYHSDDLLNWTRQEALLLAEPGTGKDDQVIGQHCDVVTEGERAFVFYFTHPGRLPSTSTAEMKELQRSCIQVAELEYRDSILACDRNKEVFMALSGRKK